MIISRFNVIPVLLTFSLLTACAGTLKTGPSHEATPPAAKAEETLPKVSLQPEMLYDLLVGEIAGQRGQIGVAAATLGKVAQQTRDPRVAERATLAALYAKRYDEALQSARLWVELRPGDAEAKEAMISALLELDRVAEARSQFEALFGLEETRRHLDQAYLRAAAVLGRASNRVAAIDVMQSLVALNPRSASAHFAMAHLMVRGGDLDKALATIDEVLKLRPDWEEAALFKVRLLLSQKDPNKARAFFESFLDSNSRATNVRLNYARFLIDQKEWQKALVEFKRVAADAPDDADTIYAVGLLSLQNNRLEEAEKYLKRALSSSARRTIRRDCIWGRSPNKASATRKPSVGTARWMTANIISRRSCGSVWCWRGRAIWPERAGNWMASRRKTIRNVCKRRSPRKRFCARPNCIARRSRC